MSNIILIGMPGTGKSTVGVLLAKHLGYDFVDTDLMISRDTGKTLPMILKAAGVAGFLELEGRIGKAVDCQKTVIATGGSMVFCEDAMHHLRAGGITVWLDTEPMELERRINRSADRGIAAEPGTTIGDIYAVRRPLYEKYADIHIRCTGGMESVVSQVMQALADRSAVV